MKGLKLPHEPLRSKHFAGGFITDYAGRLVVCPITYFPLPKVLLMTGNGNELEKVNQALGIS